MQDMQDIKSLFMSYARQAFQLFLSHPLITLLAVGAWGLHFVEIVIPPLAFITTIVSWLFVTAFFGTVALQCTGQQIRIKNIGSTIRRYLVGIIVITMFLAFIPLLLLPFISLLLPFNIAGNIAVIIFGVGPIIIPSIAAMWYLVIDRNTIVDAIVAGFRLLKGKWLPAICLGIGYQALASGAHIIRAWLLANDLMLSVFFELAWITAEAIFRLGVLLWLFPHSRQWAEKKTSKTANKT